MTTVPAMKSCKARRRWLVSITTSSLQIQICCTTARGRIHNGPADWTCRTDSESGKGESMIPNCHAAMAEPVVIAVPHLRKVPHEGLLERDGSAVDARDAEAHQQFAWSPTKAVDEVDSIKQGNRHPGATIRTG